MSKHPYHERKLRVTEDALADERAAMRSCVAANARLSDDIDQLVEDLHASRQAAKGLADDLQAERMRVEVLRDQLVQAFVKLREYEAALHYALQYIEGETAEGRLDATVSLGTVVEHLRGVLGIVGDTGIKIEVL